MDAPFSKIDMFTEISPVLSGWVSSPGQSAILWHCTLLFRRGGGGGRGDYLVICTVTMIKQLSSFGLAANDMQNPVFRMSNSLVVYFCRKLFLFRVYIELNCLFKVAQ